MAKKFISYEKMSKKQQKEINTLKRNTWGSLNPVSRKTSKPNAYNRSKIKSDFRKLKND